MKDSKSIITLFAGIALGAVIGVFVTSKVNKDQIRSFGSQLKQTRKKIGRAIKNRFRKEEKRIGKLNVVDPTL